MPLYEYECALHGAFEAMRQMSESRQEQLCPECGAVSPRVILNSPALATMPGPLRRAHARNDASKHAPVSSKQLKHGSGCACCKTVAVEKGGAATASSTSRSFPGRRPWMISH
jgi:putative FmdB family regulatory protein